MATESKAYYIGTSGWRYKHWIGPFYPDSVPDGQFLEYYTDHFSTVEINNSFYRLPTSKMLTKWRDTVPDNFTFSVKASRFITHMKKLKDPKKPVHSFLRRIKILDDKLGPILFQLPPSWKINIERLSSFLEILPKDYRYTFEFRDPSWFDSKVYEILSKYEAAFCIYELDGRLSPKEVTTDFVYIRLHGPEGAYKGQYKTDMLNKWAYAFHEWKSQGKQIYCYFDNDEAGYAVEDALRLKKIIKGGSHGKGKKKH